MTFCGAESIEGAVDQQTNVVIFLVDDLGWTDVGCYGSSFYDTPNIDRLADEGVRFTNAYAACHVCSPTRASILTGKSPARLHLTDWLPGRRDFPFQQLKNVKTLQQLPDAEITLAEALREHGYATGHFGKWHLGEEPAGPTSQGFAKRVPSNWNKGWPRAGYHSPFQFEGLVDEPGDYLTDRLTDAAIDFIGQNQKRPFFLYLSHFAVHDPIQGREDLVAKYEHLRSALPDSDGPAFLLEGNPDDPQPLTQSEMSQRIEDVDYAEFKVLPERTVKIKQRQDNVQFAAMIESMDESLGRVMTKLRELNIADNTLIIFCSDNGGMSAANFGNPQRVIAPDRLDLAYSTSNLPLRGGKGWLYEGGIRVPMIVAWPGHGLHGRICDEPVISMDLFPTILDCLDQPLIPQQHVDGKSLKPLLMGADSLDRKALYWHFPHYSNHGMQSPGGAIRAGHFKLLEYFEKGTVQLFDLGNDPGEQDDLVELLPEKSAELRNLLSQWREEVGAEMMQTNPEWKGDLSQ